MTHTELWVNYTRNTNKGACIPACYHNNVSSVVLHGPPQHQSSLPDQACRVTLESIDSLPQRGTNGINSRRVARAPLYQISPTETQACQLQREISSFTLLQDSGDNQLDLDVTAIDFKFASESSCVAFVRPSIYKVFEDTHD